MQANKLPVILFLMLIPISCIESFEPRIPGTAELIVINGRITDKPGMHYVEISRSYPLKESEFIPVGGCVVHVEDNSGMGVTYSESEPGVYRAELNKDFLEINRAYRLLVYTPEGAQYISQYDSLLACPPVTDLFYEVEIKERVNQNVIYWGLQFYVKVEGKDNESRNLLWELEETYEYTAPFPLTHTWDGTTLYEVPLGTLDTLYTCFKTGRIKALHVASTHSLKANALNRHPLNYVSNQSERLSVKYSLLVSQYSLSNDAFQYWENMKKMSSGRGGLYETQPFNPRGNIYNVHDEQQDVLGYFYASEVRQKRISVEDKFEYPVQGVACIGTFAFFMEELPKDYTYLSSLAVKQLGLPFVYGNLFCFDCTLHGGTLERPEYWDEQ